MWTVTWVIVDCESSGEARALGDVDGDVEDELNGDVGVADGEVSEGGSAAHRTIAAEALGVQICLMRCNSAAASL